MVSAVLAVAYEVALPFQELGDQHESSPLHAMSYKTIFILRASSRIFCSQLTILHSGTTTGSSKLSFIPQLPMVCRNYLSGSTGELMSKQRRH